jgi:hypothetical protein
MSKYQLLITAFTAATPRNWCVLGKFHSTAFGLSEADDAIGEIFGVGPQAEANANFLCLVQNLIPDILTDLERLQQLEAELHCAKERANVLESKLDKSSAVMLEMREQIEQMRGLFDDEDGAIRDACNCHDAFNEELLKVFS